MLQNTIITDIVLVYHMFLAILPAFVLSRFMYQTVSLRFSAVRVKTCKNILQLHSQFMLQDSHLYIIYLSSLQKPKASYQKTALEGLSSYSVYMKNT